MAAVVPKTVQEMAAAVMEPPTGYVRPELDRHADEMPEPIPLIDLGRLTDADEAEKLRTALDSWGLFLVTNHGIEDSLLDAMMSVSRDFFGQPLEEKLKCSNLVDGHPIDEEGYANDRVQTQQQIKNPNPQFLDWNDRLRLKVEPEDDRNFALWPSYPESFRDVLHQYVSKIREIRDTVLRSIAKLLELDEDYFVNQFSEKASAFARFHYYPPCVRPDLVLGLKPHSDIGLLTILLVDEYARGLQVQKDGKWYNVPTKPYTLVINLADCMEVMNNGIFRSPIHRVVVNAEKKRLSLSVFYLLDGETVLEPAPGLVDERRPSRYSKIKTKDLVDGFFKHYKEGKKFPDTLKI
jgi:isopenicillin N synthase-like dioxygenase